MARKGGSRNSSTSAGPLPSTLLPLACFSSSGGSRYLAPTAAPGVIGCKGSCIDININAMQRPRGGNLVHSTRCFSSKAQARAANATSKNVHLLKGFGQRNRGRVRRGGHGAARELRGQPLDTEEQRGA